MEGFFVTLVLVFSLVTGLGFFFLLAAVDTAMRGNRDIDVPEDADWLDETPEWSARRLRNGVERPSCLFEKPQPPCPTTTRSP